MIYLLIFACYLLLDKALDAALTWYNLKCQAKVAAAQKPEVEKETEEGETEEERTIGFIGYGNNLREIEEEEEE